MKKSRTKTIVVLAILATLLISSLAFAYVAFDKKFAFGLFPISQEEGIRHCNDPKVLITVRNNFIIPSVLSIHDPNNILSLSVVSISFVKETKKGLVCKLVIKIEDVSMLNNRLRNFYDLKYLIPKEYIDKKNSV